MLNPVMLYSEMASSAADRYWLPSRPIHAVVTSPRPMNSAFCATSGAAMPPSLRASLAQKPRWFHRLLVPPSVPHAGKSPNGDSRSRALTGSWLASRDAFSRCASWSSSLSLVGVVALARCGMLP